MTPSGDGNKYLKVTYTDVDIPLAGIYPRAILADFMVFATDNPDYDPYYGTYSNLTQYTEGKPVIRTLKLINNPFNDIYKESYVSKVPSPNGKGVDNKIDSLAIVYNKGFTDGDKLKNLNYLSNTKTNLVTQKPLLGTLLNTIETIDANYDLSGPLGTMKSLPQGDFLSFLTFSQAFNFIKDTPQEVISKVFDGTYNNIKIEPVVVSSRTKPGTSTFESVRLARRTKTKLD